MPATLTHRIDRWTRLVLNDRPPRGLVLVRFPDPAWPRPWPWPDNVPQRIAWAQATYERKLEQMQWLDDDALPYLDPFTSTEIFAEAFGCPVHYPENDMPSARPLIACADELSRVRTPSLDHPALARVFQIADELRRRNPGALMRLPDIQSPMDIAALIWDKNDFYAALIENPRAIADLAGRVHDLLVAFVDEWFKRYGRAFIAHYPDYYMPFGLTLSEDEVGVISQEMFDELFLPELSELSRRYGALGMHCCANSRHQWASFARIPGLKVLNLIRPKNQMLEAYGVFAGHCVQFHGSTDVVPALPELVAAIGPDARVVLEATAHSRDEAISLQDQLSRALVTISGK